MTYIRHAYIPCTKTTNKDMSQLPYTVTCSLPSLAWTICRY